MHAVDRLQKVLGDERSGLLCDELLLRYDVVELPVATQLEQRVEVHLVVEETVDIDDVGVVEEGLDLELSDELL